MITSPSLAVAIAGMALLSLTLVSSTRADVPTTVDVAACNATAHQEMKGATASPNASDHLRAETARTAAPPARAAEPASRAGAVESGDPQIHGMEGEGAKHAGYQAAYRSCMRRKGF